MRNSLMHGHIEILLNKKGEIEFVFRDKYNKRNEVISIILEDLEEAEELKEDEALEII